MSKLPSSLPAANVEVTTFQDMWAVDDTTLNNLSTFISKGDFLSWFVLLFSDVSNAVTNVMCYPFSLDVVAQDFPDNIYIGGKPATSNNDFAITASRLTKTVATPVKFSMNVPTPTNQSFLDYEPFTTYQMYIPFVGNVSLNARNILGKTLTLEYVVDFHTGGCTTYLYNNTETLYTTSFQIGATVPFGSTNAGDAEASRIMGCISAGLSAGLGGVGTPAHAGPTKTTVTTHSGSTSSKTTTARNPSTGRQIKTGTSTTLKGGSEKTEVTTVTYPAQDGKVDYASVANGIMSIANDKESYIAGAPGGDFSQFTCASTPYLIITKTHIHDIEDYGYYFGYACAEKIKLSEHHGYCELSNIHMEGMSGVTAEEIDVIENYLKNGVILP